MVRWIRSCLVLAAIFSFVDSAIAQQEIPVCNVTTGQQLLDALRCVANNASTCAVCPGGTPDRIVIPTNATIEVPFMDNSTNPPTEISNIYITSANSTAQRPLKITIRGKVKWVGGPDPTSNGSLGLRVFTVDGADSLTFDGDGTGRIYSDLNPALPANHFMPRASRVFNANNLTIQGLSIDHLGTGADLGSAFTRNVVTFLYTSFEEMGDYGIFCVGNNVLIDGCRVDNPSNLSVMGFITGMDIASMAMA